MIVQLRSGGYMINIGTEGCAMILKQKKKLMHGLEDWRKETNDNT